MAYFGDATAYASILNVVLALAFALPVFIGVLLIALAMALAISALQAHGQTFGYAASGDGAFNAGFGLGDGVVFLGGADRSYGLSFWRYSIGCLV